jgi:hypothetical protein
MLSKSVFVDPVASLYLPAGHASHVIFPAVSWYVPEGQVVHEVAPDDEPSTSSNFWPTRHGVLQLVWPEAT